MLTLADILEIKQQFLGEPLEIWVLKNSLPNNGWEIVRITGLNVILVSDGSLTELKNRMGVKRTTRDGQTILGIPVTLIPQKRGTDDA